MSAEPKKKVAPPLTREMKFELEKLTRLDETGELLEKKVTNEQMDRSDFVLQQKRIGPKLLKIGLSFGMGYVAYTYLLGFYHLSKKNRNAWSGTWRSRVMIIGPLMSAFFAGNGAIPVPFEKEIEEYTGHKSITMFDIIKANQVKERKFHEDNLKYM
mmetsp:Transcript_7878/g.15345  ORF Transcript_7878/g.15345 Transcript_7878/m.15345 type:complete len:157 (+) Transcript_7878:44-514(+)